MILLTGGAGFIGSIVGQHLNELGREDIIVVDRLRETEKWLNLRAFKYADYVHADRLFDDDFFEILDSASAIIHLGASSSTTVTDMDFLMSNNVNYSKNLFQLSLDLKIPFIYASSAATYGDGEQGYQDDHEGIKNLTPMNRYGYSKQLFDEWLLAQKEMPTHWFGLKFFNVYGPYEYHKGGQSSVVLKAYKEIKKDGVVKLFQSHRSEYRDGHQRRDFVYAKDCARAIIEMLNPSAARFSGIYNLGTGQARTFEDLVKATFAALGMDPKIEYIPMPENLREHYQYFTEAEMKKFSEFLPHFKFSTLEDGVADYVQNHLVKDLPHG